MAYDPSPVPDLCPSRTRQSVLHAFAVQESRCRASARDPTCIGGTSTGEEQGAAIALMPRLRPRAAAFGVAGAAAAAKSAGRQRLGHCCGHPHAADVTCVPVLLLSAAQLRLEMPCTDFKGLASPACGCAKAVILPRQAHMGDCARCDTPILQVVLFTTAADVGR